ncbi:MAG: RNA polymerase sigma factor [Chitinophagaceae bacterium]
MDNTQSSDSHINQEIEHIILGCIQLQRESQKKFYTYFYSYAMSVCMRYAHSDDDAMEITNDGFLKIFKDLSSFSPRYDDIEASLRGWMRRIMINTAIDHFRRNHKHRINVSIDDHVFHLADHSEDAVNKLSYEELFKVVQQLSPMYRAVFNLYVIDGFKHEEIARHLKISIGTSKSNLAKAKINIQKMIVERHKSRYGQTAI